jgi:hypothetical protein
LNHIENQPTFGSGLGYNDKENAAPEYSPESSPGSPG